MWGAALREIEAAYETRLPGAIAQVAALRGVELDGALTRYPGRVPGLEVRTFPALVIRLVGRGRVDMLRQDALRQATLPLRIAYGFQAQDVAMLARQLEYVPEALVMVAESMHDLSPSVLGVESMEVEWQPRLFRWENGPFEGWVALDATFGLMVSGQVLA